MNLNAIGVFDSGVGGLTVVNEIMKALPNEEIIYFGDTARVPYGAKSKETVTKYSKQIVNFLQTKHVKAVIIACGTASSNSYEELVEAFDIPIFEMVRPGVAGCVNSTKNKVVGVIATTATIRSGAYDRLLNEKCPGITVYSKACPLFVPLAEEGWTNNSIAQLTTEIYLQELIDKEIDTLIMGCTHYPLLLDCIKRTVGSIATIDPAVTAAEQLRAFIKENDLERVVSTTPVHHFYVSDNTEKFGRICRLALGSPYPVEIVDIDKY